MSKINRYLPIEKKLIWSHDRLKSRETCLSSAVTNSWMSSNALQCLVSGHNTWPKRTFVWLGIWLTKKGGAGRGSFLEGLTQDVCTLGQQSCYLNSTLPSYKDVKEKMLTLKRKSWLLSLLPPETNTYIKGLPVLGPAALAPHSPKDPLGCISCLA